MKENGICAHRMINQTRLSSPTPLVKSNRSYSTRLSQFESVNLVNPSNVSFAVEKTSAA